MGLYMGNFPRLICRNRRHFARAFESSFLAWDIEPLFAIRGRWEESCRKVRSSWLLSLPQRPQRTRRRSDRHFLCGEGTSKHLFEPRIPLSLFLFLFFFFSLSLSYPFIFSFLSGCASHVPDCIAAEKLAKETRDEFIFPISNERGTPVSIYAVLISNRWARVYLLRETSKRDKTRFTLRRWYSLWYMTRCHFIMTIFIPLCIIKIIQIWL